MRRTYERPKSLSRIIGGWLFFIFMLIVLVFIGTHFVMQRTLVLGSAMYPTIAEGDYVWIDTLTYRFTDPKRYDVVVFPFGYDGETYFLKRVVGLPGETLQIMDGALYINGTRMEDPYHLDPIANAGLASTAITLREDEYFVLGDNRNDSSDSRTPTVGNIKRNDITGKAVALIWPITKFRVL